VIKSLACIQEGRGRLFALLVLGLVGEVPCRGDEGPASKHPVVVRGIYGGVPTQLLERGGSLADHGINAVWLGSGSLTNERIALLRGQGARVFAEFNTMHDAAYVKGHPGAAPIGGDGRIAPPPEDWQGVCPTHPGYRKARMDEFRRVLARFAIDGIWLDYHHAQANWERAVPILLDTCFCDRCWERFATERKPEVQSALLKRGSAERAQQLVGPLKVDWVRWRCAVYTDWVREFRSIRDEVRPGALLGTFHCPWSDDDYEGALRTKLAIDLKAQAPFLDVLSPMPYHARFGHAEDTAWIARQIAWLGRTLDIKGHPGERLKIWPIVQLADWGEPVPAAQVGEVLELATRPPATGVTVFAWGGIAKDRDKVERLGQAYRALRP
jgi:hypothetical protein